MIFFDTIVKRVANFSIQSYEINKQNIFDFFNTNALFQLCVLSASGSLYADIVKSKSKKTESALNNYFTRAHLNPTPFGVFNSVGIMHWANTTAISKGKTLRLMVKYDNLFVASKIIEANDENWLHANYCLNPTIYFLSEEKLSFYKSENDKNNTIKLSYAELDVDEDLLWLLDQFKGETAINSVIENLISQGFDKAEVAIFLKETIESGLIIDTFLFNSFTNKLYNSFPLFESGLIAQKEHLLRNNQDVENFKNTFIKEQDFLFENSKPKDFYAIHSFDSLTGSLNVDIQEKIKKFIDFSLQYNSKIKPINDNLSQFFTQFQNKFNEGFVSLNSIFNPYSGIKYTTIKAKKESKLHEDILMKILSSTGKNLFLNLSADENIELKTNKVPATFNAVLENLICKTTGEEIVYFHGLGDPSALGFIARFSDVTQELCQDIINYEIEVNKNKLIAEINCVGNFRSINLSAAQQSYHNYIPINTAYADDENVILLSDIYVHAHNNDFSLVSKKHHKQIIPKKTSALNPKLFESDVYNFLCDYEFYNQEINSVNFNFNAYHEHLLYAPRIFLEKGILLYPAQILLVYNGCSIDEFNNYVQDKIKEYSFSKKIVIADNYGKTILDTENRKNIDVLFEKVKDAKTIYISEFLYDSFKPAATQENENFAHEIIVGVKNPHYSRPDIEYSKMDISPVVFNNAAVVSDWLYLEVFCNTHADAELFTLIYDKIILENRSDLFFFIHYANPDRHLRLRFKTYSLENKQFIIKEIHELKSQNIISKYHILPYEPEVYRYGGIEIMELSEIIFDLDSRDFLTHIANNNLEENDLEIIAILKIKNYFTFLGFSLDNMILNCERVIKSYSKEFDLTVELRKDFNKQYSALKSEIEAYQYDSFLEDAAFQDSLVENLNNSNLEMDSYAWLIIHMSMNRHFKEAQRFNEFKIYYMTKCYLNQLKFKI